MVTNLEQTFELTNKRTKKRTTDNKGFAKERVGCYDNKLKNSFLI